MSLGAGHTPGNGGATERIGAALCARGGWPKGRPSVFVEGGSAYWRRFMGISVGSAIPALPLIAAAFIVGLFGFLGAAAPVWLTNRQRRRERAEDRADQARVRATAEATAGKVDAVVAKTDTATDRIAEAAAAAQQASTATLGKLAEIHTLVNSNLTEAVQGELDSCERELASLKELVALRQTLGQEASLDAIAKVKETEQRILKLRAKLEDRKRAQAEADGL